MTLIERLEKAGEGSLALDIELMVLLGGARDVGDGVYYGPNTETWHTSDAAENEGCWMLPAPSRSLDAALALAERTGLRPYMADATIKGRWRWMLENPALLGDLEAEPWTNGVAATPALALCLAVLRATQEQPNV